MEQMETRSGAGSMIDFPWWVFLITGIAWMIIAVIVLLLAILGLLNVLPMSATVVFGMIAALAVARLT